MHNNSPCFTHRVGGDFDEELMSDTVDIMRARIEGITRPIVSLHK